MKLTKKKAIELTIELWEWLAKTGGKKDAWPKWGEYGGVDNGCFLCEYVGLKNRMNGCIGCPLGVGGYGCESETDYGNWKESLTVKTKKKYAKFFLEQLKQLRG